MAMTIQSRVKSMVLAAQSEAFKEENTPAERLHRLDQQMERKEDESLYFMDRIWVPLVGGLRTIIMDEAHKTSWDVHLPLAEFSYKNSYHSSIRCASFEALYGRKFLIKEKLKAAKYRQKSYVDNRRKPLEFEVGDQVLLKVSPGKGVIRFRKKSKLAPRMYVRGKVNYLDNIDVDLFNVNELRMFLQDLGYDPKQIMFYHYKLPNKSLDYGLRPLSCDADVYLSPFKSTIEIEELDDDVLLNAPVVGSSKRLSLGWINEADVGDSSVGKNDNVNVVGSSKRLALDDKNVNADDEYEQGDVKDEEVIGNDREDFIVDEEHVTDEVEVNMEGFTFSVQEQGVEQTVTPNVDLTDEALEVLDFDSFDSNVGDDTVSITRRGLRKLRKTGGQSTGIVNTLFVGQEFPNKASAKARIKAYAVETRRKIGIMLLHTNLNFPIKAVKEHTKKQFRMGVSKTKAFRAKAKAEVHLRDANNGIYPVAYGIVESESKESWTWFLSCLGDDLDLEAQIQTFTFHNRLTKGGHYKELLWKCATATTEVHFERAMDEFKGYNRLAHEWLRKIPPKHWSRS
ncbi:putative reverse transcriptase domain-containing protein [Tanacetum coccineum]